MKQAIISVLMLGLLGVTSPIYAAEQGRTCQVEHFIGTGETMELSFSLCREALATPTFLENFHMDCQHGLVTYQVKARPSAKYLHLGNDGSPVSCSST